MFKARKMSQNVQVMENMMIKKENFKKSQLQITFYDDCYALKPGFIFFMLY